MEVEREARYCSFAAVPVLRVGKSVGGRSFIRMDGRGRAGTEEVEESDK